MTAIEITWAVIAAILIAWLIWGQPPPNKPLVVA
jgi:hypothetical protein